VTSSDPIVNTIFLQQCEEILNGMTSVEITTAMVRQLLVTASGAMPDISAVAEQLHISERTLRRRLKRESTSFRAVLNDVRNTLARRYLTGTGLAATDIATLLGYSDPENFYRAFARWNGMTPTEYRGQQE